MKVKSALDLIRHSYHVRCRRFLSASGEMPVPQSNIIEGRLIERPNRFLGVVDISGIQVKAFIPNPGRMYELMVPDKHVYLRPVTGNKRKTRYNLIGVEHAGVLVSIDSNLPNRFMKRMLREHKLEMFSGYETVTPEPRYYNGRFDFKLEGLNGITVIEVKSCTLVEDGRAIFPDAPTKRGARHMKHLARALTEKVADVTAVVFIIQRPDVQVFSPNDPTDPIFSNALRSAAMNGVKVYALKTKVVNWDLQLLSQVPVELEHFSTSH
jgi:sugar fermentation stimulation protein A